MTSAPGPSGPRRLKDDPDFRWETGCDLADEAAVVGGYDLASTRASLMARIAAEPAPVAASGSAGGAGWMAALKPGLAALVLAGAVGAAYVAGLHAGARPSLPPAAPVVEQVAPEAPLATSALDGGRPEVEVRAPAAEPQGSSVALPTAPSTIAPRQVAAARAPLEAGVGTDAVEIVPDASSAPVEGVPPLAPAAQGTAEGGPRTSSATGRAPDLEQQLGMYDAAVEALEAGQASAAREGFERYLATWADGDLRPEAQLGLLQALHGTGDAAGAERLASEIQDLPAFSGRRSQILRLRAESLVVLGRCDEAVVVVEALSSKDGAEIRRACRSKRREEP